MGKVDNNDNGKNLRIIGQEPKAGSVLGVGAVVNVRLGE